MLDIEHVIRLDHLSSRAVIAEVTVDPGRDTPQRMAAYARLTGSSWPMLTGTADALTRLWTYFGVFYQKVPEGSPAGVDWQTGQPYTYDVDHSDGFVLLDAHLHERFAAGGMVKVDAMPTPLHRLLDVQGWADLKHPGGGSWTVSEGLDGLAWLLGRTISMPF